MPRACVVKKLFSESSWSFPASALPLPQPSYRALPTRFAVLIGCNLCRSKSGVRAPSLPTCRQALFGARGDGSAGEASEV
ncbi:uncharacterized protein LOC127693051 isoform X10 [Apodemus sylvaticus]|uniref:uncharacterized protein LOC127693051 isoform X10 n=1 Tax=Apodemus sylvaticus TaxID=10129 RepID=UPI002242F4E6|nr:uncharacterized protein LOC127693051 isoform X10 [Apodemus sylvaticus]